MRHLSTPKRVEPDDSVVQGMEAVFALVLFLGLGVLIDRWLDTAPVFTIAVMLIGAVGVFFRFKYAYIARMDRLEADRRGRSRPGSGQGSTPESTPESTPGSNRVVA